MATASPAPAHSRARRATVFLAVVWSIGAAFLALEAGMTELTWFGSKRVLPADIVLPRQSPSAAAHCEEIVRALPSAAPDAVSKQAWYLAWRLGYALGTADGAITAGAAQGPELENVLRQAQQVTAALGIPAPALPRHARSAYALRDFSVFLEEDTPCIAAALQARYSPRYAAIYKFGAAVGVAGVYRRVTPQVGDVLSPQLRIYGAAAGIPAGLYRSLSEQPGSRPAGAGAESMDFIVTQIDAYIKSAN